MGPDRFDLNSSDLLRLYSFTFSTLHAFGWGLLFVSGGAERCRSDCAEL